MDRVPLTVSNFIDLANRGFYTGIAFHRVIDDFMLQIGCPNTKSEATLAQAGKGNAPPNSSFTNIVTGESCTRNSAGCIQDEFVSKDSNLSMTLAMANTGDRDSGGSQFFINVVANTNLDWFETENPGSKHPVFGRIVTGSSDGKPTGGAAVIAAIAKTPTNPKTDRPTRPIRITAITIKLPQPVEPADTGTLGAPEPEPE